jgi:hypothetical protein
VLLQRGQYKEAEMQLTEAMRLIETAADGPARAHRLGLALSVLASVYAQRSAAERRSLESQLGEPVTEQSGGSFVLAEGLFRRAADLLGAPLVLSGGAQARACERGFVYVREKYWFLRAGGRDISTLARTRCIGRLLREPSVCDHNLLTPLIPAARLVHAGGAAQGARDAAGGCQGDGAAARALRRRAGVHAGALRGGGALAAHGGGGVGGGGGTPQCTPHPHIHTP